MLVLIGALLVVIGLLAIDNVRMRMQNEPSDIEHDRMVRPDNDSFKGTSEADKTALPLPPESLMNEYEEAINSTAPDGDTQQ